MPVPAMSYTTYSFSEITFVLAHPSLGQCVLTGQGVGSVVIGRAQDSGAQEAAHDGSVMSSKIVTKHGTVTFTLHQSSAANQWLMKAHNTLDDAAAADWAQFNGTIESITTLETTNFAETCFQKRPDVNYQQNGQNVTWTLLAGSIDTAIA